VGDVKADGARGDFTYEMLRLGAPATHPASCTEHAVDTEAMDGLTTLQVWEQYDDEQYDELEVTEVGHWVRDLGLTVLTVLDLSETMQELCAVSDKRRGSRRCAPPDPASRPAFRC
jgi:hypothetical protein